MDPWSKPPKKSPWERKKNTKNVDELLNNLQDRFKEGLPQKNMGGLLVLVAFLLWMSTGFFIVDPQEQAVIKRFGDISDIVGPGPHYHLPSPIETVEKEKVTVVRRLEIGFRTIDQGPPARYRQVKKESLMLTGDENIVDVQFTVQYKIKDLQSYLFNITEPLQTVRAAAESAMREVIGDTLVMDALTTGKSKVEVNTAQLLQKILNSYDAGIAIANVKLQDVHPPNQVKEAFKDVVSAREDREKMVNKAEGYKNNLIPRARGEATQFLNQAEAYAEKTVLLARGKAKRFNAVYTEYKLAKEITRKQILLETMQIILPRANKILVDESIGKGVLPLLPLNGSGQLPMLPQASSSKTAP